MKPFEMSEGVTNLKIEAWDSNHPSDDEACLGDSDVFHLSSPHTHLSMPTSQRVPPGTRSENPVADIPGDPCQKHSVCLPDNPTHGLREVGRLSFQPLHHGVVPQARSQ